MFSPFFNNNATTSSGIYTLLPYCYTCEKCEVKLFSSTESSWFSPGLVSRPYSWLLLFMLSRVEFLRTCTWNNFLRASKPNKKKKKTEEGEYLWGKWIWQVFPGGSWQGGKMADCQKLPWVFQSTVLWVFSFRCNFRLY